MSGIVGLDRLERPADLGGRVGLHVPSVHLAGRAQVEDHDERPVVVFLDRAERLEGGELGQSQADRAQSADLKEIAAGHSVAGGDRTLAGQL